MKRSNVAKKLKKLGQIRLGLCVLAVILAAALVATFFIGPKGGDKVPAPTETTVPTTTAPATIPVTTVPVTTVPATTAPETTVPETTVPTVIPAEEPASLETMPTDGEGIEGGALTPTETTVPQEGTEGGLTGGNGDPQQQSEGAAQNESAVGTVSPDTEPAATETTAVETTVATTAAPETEAPTTAAPQTTAAPATTAAATTVPATTEAEEEKTLVETLLLPVRIALVICLVADLVAIVVVSLKIEQLKKMRAQKAEKDKDAFKTVAGTDKKEAAPEVQEAEMISGISIGKVHNIGRRPSQQDSFGTNFAGDGMLAVVADGMGGLSGGDKVSQKVVISMLSQTENIRPGEMDGVLNRMVTRVNDEVNRMLGPSGQYKSGSTLVSVLIQGGRCHWISVGDSRIYLYRGGNLIQLNHEHTYAQELMQRAMKGEISFEAVQSDPQKDRLTSFIGMGVLKHIDASLHSLAVGPGDRILLMSDGVFNTLPERTMSSILSQYPDVKMAAKAMEEQILAAQVPSQDNFTAVILGL